MPGYLDKNAATSALPTASFVFVLIKCAFWVISVQSQFPETAFQSDDVHFPLLADMIVFRYIQDRYMKADRVLN